MNNRMRECLERAWIEDRGDTHRGRDLFSMLINKGEERGPFPIFGPEFVWRTLEIATEESDAV